MTSLLFQIAVGSVSLETYRKLYCRYALRVPKAEAVAQETLAVWCSLASRLGVWALKAELEDLCFAVLQVLIQFNILIGGEMFTLCNFKEFNRHLDALEILKKQFSCQISFY